MTHRSSSMAVPLGISAALHAAAIPFATVLGRAACPLLDRIGIGGVAEAMGLTVLVAWAVYWLFQVRWARRWMAAKNHAPLTDADVSALFDGPMRAILLHVGAFLLGALVGAIFLARYGSSLDNWRFWYAVLVLGGFVVVLHAALLGWLLARDLAAAGSRTFQYRAPSSPVTLDDVVLFAVATLPIAANAVVVYRRVALDGTLLSAEDIFGLVARIGALGILWSILVVALMRGVQRRAANEALALVRDLHRPVIERRANLTTGGAWGETAAALNTAAENLEQRARLETAVRTYVGDELADATRSQDVTTTKPERCRMTVLFADIRGFTSRSATIEPEAVVEMLDAYFERAVAAVDRHGGHVDKFLGDGLMAWFDETPGTTDFGAARAVAAAEDLLRCVTELNVELEAKGEAPIQIGVGLHAGFVVRGNLGAGRRKQWTVIGDTVNLASRMESMTKTLSREILFTRPVAALLPEARVEPLGAHEIRGQPEPVPCFSLR